MFFPLICVNSFSILRAILDNGNGISVMGSFKSKLQLCTVPAQTEAMPGRNKGFNPSSPYRSTYYNCLPTALLFTHFFFPFKATSSAEGIVGFYWQKSAEVKGLNPFCTLCHGPSLNQGCKCCFKITGKIQSQISPLLLCFDSQLPITWESKKHGLRFSAQDLP